MNASFKVNLHQFLFYLSYCIFLVATILSTTFYFKYYTGTLYNVIMVGCAIILLLDQVNRTRLNKKEFLGLLICVGIFAIMFYMGLGGTKYIAAFVLLYIYCGRDISFKDIAKITIIITSFLLIFVILSAKVGLILNYTYKTSYLSLFTGETATRTREYLGFRYALNPATFLFNITCLSVYLKKDSLKAYQALILIIANIYIYNKTASRITFFLSIILILIAIIRKIYFSFRKNKIRKKRKWTVVFCFTFIFACILSIYMALNYSSSNTWMYTLNAMLGYRLSIAHSSLKEYGFSLFGQRMSYVGNGLDVNGNANTGTYNFVDCFYIQILQRYGIIILILLMILLTVALYKLYKAGNFYAVTILVILALHCIIDDLSLYLYYNTFWILIGQVLITGTEGYLNKRKKTNGTLDYKYLNGSFSN